MEDNIYIYEVPYWKKKKEYVNQDNVVIYDMRVGHRDKFNRCLPIIKSISKYNYEMLMSEKYILNRTSFSITDQSGNDIPLTNEKTFVKSRVLTKDTNK